MTNFFYLIKVFHKLLKYNCLFILNNFFIIKIVKIFYFPYRIIYRKLPLGERLKKTLEELGPSYIKIGQVLSVRSDILGEDVSNILSELQDSVPPFSFQIAKGIIEKNLGKKLEELFLEFQEKPIASASIAQVHFARDFDGNKLAVKVLRPNIAKIFARDLKFLYFLNKLAKRINKKQDYKQVLDDIKNVIKREINLNFEAASADKLRENLKKETYIKIPKVYWNKTTNEVLTLEFVDGVSIKTLDKNNAERVEEVLKKLSSLLFLQAFRDGYYHADLHPGNIHLDAQDNLILFDFGVMGYLNEHNRQYLAQMWLGFLEKDYKKVAELHFKGGFVPENENIHAFETACRYVGEGILSNSMGSSGSRVILEMVKISKDFNLPVNPELMLLQKNMFYVEGIAKNLGYSGNFWGLSKNIMKNWAKENFSIKNRLKQRAEEFLDTSTSLKELISLAKDYYLNKLKKH